MVEGSMSHITPYSFKECREDQRGQRGKMRQSRSTLKTCLVMWKDKIKMLWCVRCCLITLNIQKIDLPSSSHISNGCRESGRCNFLTSNFAWDIEPAAFIIFFFSRIEMAASSFCSSGGKAVWFITFDSLCPVRLPSVTSKFQSSCHFGFLVADRDKLEYI